MDRNIAPSPVYGVTCMVVSVVGRLAGMPVGLAGLFAMVGFLLLGLSVGMSLAGRGGDR